MPDSTPPSSTLSDREIECLTWAALGKTSWEIGRIIGLSEDTINYHMKHAMRKLTANSRIEAVAKAVKLDLIQPWPEHSNVVLAIVPGFLDDFMENDEKQESDAPSNTDIADNESIASENGLASEKTLLRHFTSKHAGFSYRDAENSIVSLRYFRYPRSKDDGFKAINPAQSLNEIDIRSNNQVKHIKESTENYKGFVSLVRNYDSSVLGNTRLLNQNTSRIDLDDRRIYIDSISKQQIDLYSHDEDSKKEIVVFTHLEKYTALGIVDEINGFSIDEENGDRIDLSALFDQARIANDRETRKSLLHYSNDGIIWISLHNYSYAIAKINWEGSSPSIPPSDIINKIFVLIDLGHQIDPEPGHSVVGSSINDVILAGLSNDIIYGGGGDDILIGGDGNDIIYGGEGSDTAKWGSTDQIILSFLNIEGDILALNISKTDHTNIFTDKLFSVENFSVLSGSDSTLDWHATTGINFINVNISTGSYTTSNELHSLASSGTVYGFSNVTGSKGNDLIIGSQTSNLLSGGSGNDYLDGGGLHDRDILDGGDGDDYIIADLSDNVSGGDGIDTLVLTGAGQVAVNVETGQIFNFSTGQYLTSMKGIEVWHAGDGTIISFLSNN